MTKPKTQSNYLYSFAVVADTHLNQSELECNSPFEANKLSNTRTRYVIAHIKKQDIKFVVHLGDLIHPVPDVEPLYREAAARFHEQLATLDIPIYLLPGNHDVGDKPSQWSPVASITEQYIALWEKHFGKHYQAFTHDNCLFILLNAQLINSNLPSEKKQQEWLTTQLINNDSKRVFIALHYPPYLYDRFEDDHYDNIAEPGRSWFLNLLDQHNVEAVFAGHVHHYWYNRHKNTDLYLMPSTSFCRQDFSEMFKISPEKEFEFGRNDAAKLGYFLIHVYDDAHECQFIRTNGIEHVKDAILPINKQIPHAPIQKEFPCSFGFDLRQSWAEPIPIAPSGALDEFIRKEVRNDYPLLALTELGVHKVRIPISDLKNETTMQRVATLCSKGYEFTLFSFNRPTEHEVVIIKKYAHILSGWELSVNTDNLKYLEEILVDFEDTELAVYISRMWSHKDNQDSSGQYYHAINHGYLTENKCEIEAISQAKLKNFKGVVFRISGHEDPFPEIQRIESICKEYSINASIHLKMSKENPAQAIQDDRWVSCRLASAFLASLITKYCTVYADTLVDVDRGHFVRNGILDRHCNPRESAKILRNLNALFYGKQDLSITEYIINSDWLKVMLSDKQNNYTIKIGIKPGTDAILYKNEGKYLHLITGDL